MDFDEILQVVECALGTDRHLLQIALPLSCGHFVCKNCIPADTNYQFACSKCNKTNQINLSLCEEPELIKFYMQKHLKSLSNLINQNIEIEIDILKSKHKIKHKKILVFIAITIFKKN